VGLPRHVDEPLLRSQMGLPHHVDEQLPAVFV
jgi:hypothetical protein